MINIHVQTFRNTVHTLGSLKGSSKTVLFIISRCVLFSCTIFKVRLLNWIIYRSMTCLWNTWFQNWISHGLINVPIGYLKVFGYSLTLNHFVKYIRNMSELIKVSHDVGAWGMKNHRVIGLNYISLWYVEFTISWRS